MFSKLILAAAVAIPLGVLGLSGSAMAGYSPTSHTPIARLHSEDRASCSVANDYGIGFMRDCDEQSPRVAPVRERDSNTHARSGHMGSGHTGRR